MSGEVFLAVLAVLGTLVAGLGGVVLQGRLEQRKWLRERRAALYVELLADAIQRQTWVEDLDWRYAAGAELDHAQEQRQLRRWDLLPAERLVLKQAEVELFGQPRMLHAWTAYVKATQALLFLIETREAREPEAEAAVVETAKAVRAAGGAYGGN